MQLTLEFSNLFIKNHLERVSCKRHPFLMCLHHQSILGISDNGKCTYYSLLLEALIKTGFLVDRRKPVLFEHYQVSM
jgi:hypothetical protein